ncbi:MULTISPECIES: hypothetical protein [Bacillus]|uniref:hypothetical protein n=1 Tax=Bacillus TaxID=1386 RepID=UPI00148EBE20|nr:MULTISPECIES: hypothetical protein [Bacillus]WHF25299.1 hypothetical protein QJS65_10605 [Bacillus altitudinis]
MNNMKKLIKENVKLKMKLAANEEAILKEKEKMRNNKLIKIMMNDRHTGLTV